MLVRTGVASLSRHTWFAEALTASQVTGRVVRTNPVAVARFTTFEKSSFVINYDQSTYLLQSNIGMLVCQKKNICFFINNLIRQLSDEYQWLID